MRISLSSLALLATLGASSFAMGSPATDDFHEGWVQDFDEGVKLAREQGKDLFVDFTGSDWCGWCIRLGEEVFQHEEFREPVMAQYVMVMLDFPRDEEVKAKVPNPERNAELRDKYAVGGYPTILLMTADGDVYGQTGYQEGGPEKYVEHINELREEGRKSLAEVLEITKAYAAATPEEQLAVWERAVAKVEELGEGSPFTRTLADVVKAAFEFDADNAKGLKERACVVLIGAGRFDDDVDAAVRAIDPDNGKGLLEQAVEAQVYAVDSEEAVEAACEAIAALAAGKGIQDEKLEIFLYANAAFWYENVLSNHEKAVEFARLSVDAGADGRTRDMLDGILGG